jgi:phosphoglycolate phosphatase-like HAD superfamily hydrolase
MAAIIFDFDGTIGDSFDFVVDFLATEAGIELTTEQRKALHGYSMMAIARRMGHPRWRMLRLLFRGRRRMERSIDQVRPFKGLPEMIAELHAEGHELFIVSSNSVTNVRAFLEAQSLQIYFLEIYGGIGIFGKAPALRGVLKEHSFDKPDVVYIGDELRDVQAAQAVGIRSVAVTWGFSRAADLQALHPTAVAHTPAELRKILEEV